MPSPLRRGLPSHRWRSTDAALRRSVPFTVRSRCRSRCPLPAGGGASSVVDVGFARCRRRACSGSRRSSVGSDLAEKPGALSHRRRPAVARATATASPTRTVTTTCVPSLLPCRRASAPLLRGEPATQPARPPCDAGQGRGVGGRAGPAGVDDVAGERPTRRQHDRERPATAASGTACPSLAPSAHRHLPVAPSRRLHRRARSRRRSSVGVVGEDRGDRRDRLAVVEVHHPHAGRAAALRGDLAHRHADRRRRSRTRRRSRRRGRP